MDIAPQTSSPARRRLEQQLNLLEGVQAALQVQPRVHHCGGTGHNWAPARRDDLPAMVSYLAASRFGPALLSSTMRQANAPDLLRGLNLNATKTRRSAPCMQATPLTFGGA